MKINNPKSKMLILALPYPPSVNTYWGFKGSRRFLTKKAVDYKKHVLQSFLATKHIGFGANKLLIYIQLFPPDNRKRDIDNIAKSLLDALCQAGAFDDDSQIDKLIIERKEKNPLGHCIVCIKEK